MSASVAAVPEDVQRPGWDAGCLTVLPEPSGEPLRVNRVAEHGGENYICVDVGGQHREVRR